MKRAAMPMVEPPITLQRAPTRGPTKSGAQSSKEYRERLKAERPEEYARQLERAKTRNKKNRAEATDETKKASNEKTAVRMARYRETKKAEEAEKKTTRGGILAHEAQKEKWREEYKKRASAMSHQKRTAINAKRRQKYAEQKALETPVPAPAAEPVPTAVTDDPLDERSTTAKRKALQRVRSRLPANKAAAVETLASTVKTLTPRSKQRFFGKAGLGEEAAIGRSVLQSLQNCKNKSSASASIRRSLFPHLKSLSNSKKGKLTRTCPKTIRRLQAKPRKSRPQSIILAQDFFRQQAVILPHKKSVSKKTGEINTFLQQTLLQLHCEFLKQKNASLSFSCFAKCRPVTVRLLNSATFNMCLCEYCTNVWLKVTALNKSHSLAIRGEVEAVKTTVCSLESKVCTHRQCSKCGVDNFPATDPDKQMSWHRWEMKDVVFKDKQVRSYPALPTFVHMN